MGKKYYYAKKIRNYLMKHPKEGKKQINIFRPAFFRNWKILIKHPVLLSGMFVMKVLEFSAAGSGYLEALLKKQK